MIGMPTIADALTFLESIAPSRWAFDFDNVGLLMGSKDTEVRGIAFALDASEAMVDFGRSFGANLLVTHHPILFNGTKKVNCSSSDGRLIMAMAQAGFGLIASHTNWDCAPGGISDTMIRTLGLTPIMSFGEGAEVPYSKIVTFAPPEYVDPIIDVMADAGAGNVGNYRRCAFKGPGMGTFEPLEGSDPFTGRIGKSDEIEEHRIEMICPSRVVDDVVMAIVERHPYEQPAFDVLKLKPLVEQPLGRIGELAKPLRLGDFKLHCDKSFATSSLAWGDPNKVIEKVAVVGGSGDHQWDEALKAGADVLVTGEVRHHIAKEATEMGMGMMACGHYATENPGMDSLRNMFATQFPEVRCQLFTPHAGLSARPL